MDSKIMLLIIFVQNENSVLRSVNMNLLLKDNLFITSANNHRKVKIKLEKILLNTAKINMRSHFFSFLYN